MKNLIIALSLLVAFSACESKVKKENAALKEEISRLKATNDSLKSETSQMEVSVEGYKETLAEIESNLANITENQALLTGLQSELSETNNADVAETINARINNIRELMENSRLKIVGLDKNLQQLRRQSGDKSEEILALDKQLDEASQRLIDKENEIMALRTSLEKQLEELGVELENQAQLAEELRRNLNRAYYIVGESKTLKENEIVTKEGGFIGLGRVKVINAEASNDLFTQAEKDKLETIDLDAKKANLITFHPEGSYKFVEEDNKVASLNIVDPESFWKDSNYLVVEVNK